MRYWLSAKFLNWGVALIPDEEVKKTMSFGLGVAHGLLTGQITVIDGDTNKNIH